MRARSAGLTLVVAFLGVLSMAPTPGDVGGCGTDATYLDKTAFGEARKEQDCARCTACGIANERCTRACDPSTAPDVVLPALCRPFFHDGVVCLRALDAASCDAFRGYVDDVAPSLPSECAFCRGPEPSPSFDDGGTP